MLGGAGLGSSRDRGGSSRLRDGAIPVSVPYSSTCSRTISPIRLIPSRMSSSPTPEKFSRIDDPPRPST